MKQFKNLWVSLALLFTLDAEAIAIDLVPSKTTIAAGELVSVAVNISGLSDSAAPSLGAYDVDFHFDNTLFNVNNLVWGDSNNGNQLDLNSFGSLQSSSVNASSINIFELSFDDALSLNNLQAGEFTLFTLVFNSIAAGAGIFSLSTNMLADADANALLVDSISSAQVAINSVTVPEPSSLLLFTGLFAMVLLRKKLALR